MEQWNIFSPFQIIINIKMIKICINMYSIHELIKKSSFKGLKIIKIIR